MLSCESIGQPRSPARSSPCWRWVDRAGVGGPGDGIASGGFGADTLDANTQDMYDSGPGVDTVCGPGFDTVTTDRLDRLRDPRACESVN
jgi:hypothetical protein